MSHSILLALAVLFILPGFIGIVIPIIPGIPYMFVIALLFGFFDGFAHLTGGEVGMLALVAAFSVVVDQVSGLLGARYGGASKKAVLVGFIGALVGTFLLPPFGGLAGLFVGIALAEMLQFKDHVKALRAATGGLIGAAAGIVANFLVGILFLILFIRFAI